VKDYRRSLHGGLTAVSSARSRSRSRGSPLTSGGSEFDSMSSPYLRYTSPATSAMNEANSYNLSSVSSVSSGTGLSAGSSITRPMSGYIYGHSYGYHGGHVGGGSNVGGGGDAGAGLGSGMGIASGVSIVPHPPPGYNAKDREVSARIRRYQQPES
jgi:hypothetical protein